MAKKQTRDAPRKTGQTEPNAFADPATQAQFVTLATMTVRDGFQPLLNDTDLSASDRLDRTLVLASLLNDASIVAPRLPAGLSVMEAVRDFVAYALDAGPHWNDPPDRGVPAPWLGLKEHFDVQSFITPQTELIDGRWQAPNPEWYDLPSDSGVTLRLLSHLRAKGKAAIAELEDVLRPFGGGDVFAALRQHEAEGWVHRSGSANGTIWTATSMLRLGSLSPKELATNQEAPERDRAAERLRDRRARMADLPDTRDGRTMLVELQRRGQAPTRDLLRLFPHRDWNATVRLLKALRDAGWLEVAGRTRGAEWRATEKLRSTDFQRRAALADNGW